MLGKEIIAFIIYKIHRVSSMRLLSMRQPIKKHRVVPRYQNLEKIVGFCDFLFKPSHIGEGLVRVDVSLLLSLRQRK